MTTPYYSDDLVTLYHGDCREVTGWLAADVLVTDPPYGRGWTGHTMKSGIGTGQRTVGHAGIQGDDSPETRDEVLAMWGARLAVVFGDLLIPPPKFAVQALIYAKPLDAGIAGARAGFRRDAEAIYLVGPWPVGTGGCTSILTTGGLVAGPRGFATRIGHPHAKPGDVLERIVGLADGVVADPFAGSGSTLVAAKALGRRGIGVELDERYCEIAARRLAQDTLFGGAA
jgi:site-specific DNA-methyltransferase (adenine-specific)